MSQNYNNASQYQYSYTNVPPQAPAPQPQPQFSMKWHKFLVNFSLWFSAAAAMFNAVYSGTGMHYGNAYQRRMVYAMYPAMQPVDIAYAFLLVTLAVFYIFTRFTLAKFKQNSPKMLYAVILATLFMNLLYPLMCAMVTGLPLMDLFDIPTLAGNAVYFAINKAYYGKRSQLFVQ